MDFKLEFDIPYTELEEPGFAKTRLFRDMDPDKDLRVGSNLYYEGKTGTIMLEPVNLDPEEWVKADYDTLRIRATALDYISTYWKENPDPSVMSAPSYGDHFMMRSGGHTLISALLITAIGAISSSIWSGGKDLAPVLATQGEWAANEGVHVKLVMPMQPGFAAYDYLQVRFGDFLLSLHTNGGMDLFWSDNSSFSAGHLEWKKSFARLPGVRQGMSLLGSGAQSSNVIDLMIIPFGRGNIWFIVKHNGQTFSDVYVHEEAEWNDTYGRYDITSAGKVIIYQPSDQKYACNVSIAKIGYKTSGTLLDRLIELPYAPTITPTITPKWTKTIGTPNVAATVMDSTSSLTTDVPFVANGAKTSCKVKLELTGNGTNSPFVDLYHLVFAEKTHSYNPAVMTVTADQIEEFTELGDSEEWGEQKCGVVLRDDHTDPNIRAISRRSELSGRLLIDNVPYGVYMFTRPKVTYGKNVDHVTLTGENFGVWRVRQKRFQFARSYGEQTHPEVVKDILKKCGFLESQIVVDADTVPLPASERVGQGTDEKPTELKSQPQFNSPVEDFLSWIKDNFSRWPLVFGPDMVWRYQQPTDPEDLTPVLTFKSDASYADVQAGSMYIAEDIESELEAPECNKWLIYGLDDKEAVICDGDYDADSIDRDGTIGVLGNVPLNYLGREKLVQTLDKSLNTLDVIDSVLDKAFPELSKAILWFTWKGPFSPTLKIGDVVTLQGIGDVQLTQISANGTRAHLMGKVANTTYEGRWVRDA